jgi:hypothetical protein
MNISTKYTNKNQPNSFVSKTGTIVIRNVPKGIIRALVLQSQKANDSIRVIGGSASKEGYKAIIEYLDKRKVNTKEIIKSML